MLKSPYPLREGQGELVEYIEETLSSRGVCLSHAPTGIGKTLAALLAVLPHLPENGKILYAVNRKNQIPIILKELRNINECNGTSYRATSFASKADLCRDKNVSKLSYRELLEACELQRKNWACPYFKALFENPARAEPFPSSSIWESKASRTESRVAVELERRILEEMPAPHMIERMAREVEEELGGRPVCIYEILKWTARRSEILIGTFWYSFHPVVASNLLRTLSIQRKNCILVCDEAHNLPRFCREALSHGVSSTWIEYAIRELRRYSGELEEKGISPGGIEIFLSDFLDLFRRFKFTAAGKHLPGGLVKISLKRRGITSFKGPIESLEAAGAVVLESRIREGLPPRSHLASTASFIRPFLLCDDHSYERFCVMARTLKGRPVKRLEIRCLDPAPLSSSVLDPGQSTGAWCSVLMSGTLVPGDYYRDILGIPLASHREFPNIFPIENRALFLDDTISLAWKSRSEDMYNRILEKMVAIRTNTPGGCMFFFPSYEVMNKIVDRYPDENILVEKRAATKKDEVESALEAGSSILAVMGASLSEGLDLPGLVRAIAVFGLPLERISDMIKLGMNYYDIKFPGRGRDYFYYLPAVTKIVQSAGRAHRTGEDRAALYIFDRRFCRHYLGSAPSWWEEEGIKLRGTESLISLTQDFWGERSQNL